jgi:hypothetical protein
MTSPRSRCPHSSTMGPRMAHGPAGPRGRRRPTEHAAQCRSCRVADGVVHQIGPSGTARASSELNKTHTPRRGRPSCRTSFRAGFLGLIHGRVAEPVLSPYGPDGSRTEMFLSFVGIYSSAMEFDDPTDLGVGRGTAAGGEWSSEASHMHLELPATTAADVLVRPRR